MSSIRHCARWPNAYCRCNRITGCTEPTALTAFSYHTPCVCGIRKDALASRNEPNEILTLVFPAGIIEATLGSVAHVQKQLDGQIADIQRSRFCKSTPTICGAAQESRRCCPGRICQRIDWNSLNHFLCLPCWTVRDNFTIAPPSTEPQYSSEQASFREAMYSRQHLPMRAGLARQVRNWSHH